MIKDKFNEEHMNALSKKQIREKLVDDIKEFVCEGDCSKSINAITLSNSCIDFETKLLANTGPHSHITCYERRTDRFNNLVKNINDKKLQDRITPINGDINTWMFHREHTIHAIWADYCNAYNHEKIIEVMYLLMRWYPYMPPRAVFIATFSNGREVHKPQFSPLEGIAKIKDGPIQNLIATCIPATIDWSLDSYKNKPRGTGMDSIIFKIKK